MTGTEAERGQTTVALAGVVAVVILLVGGLVTVGGAMVHRHRAQTAADAVALAAAVDSAAADELVRWYGERNIAVEHDGGRAIASSGPSMAEAWASTSVDAHDLAMPALVAIVARAEQLTGQRFVSARVIGDRVELDGFDASGLRLVAGELGLCEHGEVAAPSRTTFGLC